MDACNKVHPAVKALFQRCSFGKRAQLVQQNNLRRKRAQCHLHSPFLRDAGQQIQRRHLLGITRRKDLAALVHHAGSPLHPGQFSCDLTQKRRLAAVRLADQKHPNKMLFQLHQKFVRQLYRNRPCNAQVQPLHLLQNRLAVAIHIASCHTHPAAGGCGQKSMRKLRLVCMYRAAAQGVKDLFDLKLIQYTLPQLQRALRQVLQRELPTRQCNKNTTACPEPKFMNLRCRLCWQLSQWPGQP